MATSVSLQKVLRSHKFYADNTIHNSGKYFRAIALDNGNAVDLGYIPLYYGEAAAMRIAKTRLSS